MMTAAQKGQWRMSLPHDVIPEFGELLRRARHVAGFTQEELAEKSGLSVRGISDLERGARRSPQRLTLELLADALHLSDIERDQWERTRRAAARRQLSRSFQKRHKGSTRTRVDTHPQPLIANDNFPFVGRKNEIDQLRFAVDQSATGPGRVWMLTGEPGIGKTRLARQIAGYARHVGTLVLWGNCHEQEGAPPYWSWVQIIRQAIEDMDGDQRRQYMGSGTVPIAQIIPELREDLSNDGMSRQLGAEQARFELFDSISRFFIQLSLRQPLLIVLDDLHWADQSTLLLLSFLAREMGQRRVVILGAFRETEVDENHPLLSTLADLTRNGTLSRLPLPGFPERDVQQLVREFLNQKLPETAGTVVYERSAGNPFFAVEIIRMIRGEYTSGLITSQDWSTKVPTGVREVIGQRLSRLPDACVQVLTAAAVIGREFRLNVLELVTGRERNDLIGILDDAWHAGLTEKLNADNSSFHFVHALIQETIYLGTTSIDLADLHRRTGKALERIHKGEIDAFLPELAHHFAKAAASGSAEPAIRYGIRAGDQALAHVAYNEAIELYRRTLTIIESQKSAIETDLLEVLLKLGDVYNHVGNREEARAVFLRAANISRELDRPVTFGRAALGYTGLGIFVEGEDYSPLLQEALSWLPGGDTPLRARLLARLAHELTGVTHIEKQAALVQEAECIARRIRDPSTLTYVLFIKSNSTATLDELDDRLALSEEVAMLVAESNDSVLKPNAEVLCFQTGLATGDIERVDRHLKRFCELANRFQEPQRQWLAFVFRTTRAVLAGDFREAERFLVAAREIAERFLPISVHDRRLIPLMIAIRREQGRLDEVQHTLASGTFDRAGLLYWDALRIYARNGLTSEKRSCVEVEDLIHTISSLHTLDPNSLAAATLLSTTAEVSEQSTLGRILYGIIEPYWNLNVIDSLTRHWYGPVSYFAGRLATNLGEWEIAAKNFPHAIDVTTRMRARPLLAHSQFEMSKLLYLRNEPGDRVSACQFLDSAQGIAHETGMTALEQNIRSFRTLSHLGDI